MFACQRNSYLKELKSIVISCKKLADKYHVVLDDTVLFPEGGGQPYDKGKIGNIAVERVLREGNKAIHVLNAALVEGESYHCEIDWERRFDHMQQHSGQHLLSAIADHKYNFKTTSWDLGSKVSNVELNTAKITCEQMQDIETEVNKQIKQHRNIVVHLMTKSEALELEEVKSRGLPEDITDHKIRVIEIEGIEKNMCCGTHLTNTSEIQMVKLLQTESMRGGTRLFFLAGDRVINKLSSCFDNEVKLTKLLSNGPEEHVKMVERVQKNLKALQRNAKSHIREIAKLEAMQLLSDAKSQGYICKHREDGDMDYINVFSNEIKENNSNCILMVSAGEIKTGGMFLLCGPEKSVAELGPKISQILDGKGGGKKNRFQGKANSFKCLPEVNKLITDYVTQQ
eukprot:gene9138-10111_t